MDDVDLASHVATKSNQYCRQHSSSTKKLFTDALNTAILEEASLLEEVVKVGSQVII